MKPAGQTGLAPRRHVAAAHRAFTLLELLTVVAVIALLAALFFPAVGAARRAAQQARSKVQFAQWAAAILAFRAEYGRFPEFDASGLVNGGVTAGVGGDHVFHDVLAGRRRDGGDLPVSGPAAAGAQNHRRIAFHAFSAGEFTDDDSGWLCDASGNTAIAVLVDRNGDGVIRFGPAGDYPSAPAVAGLVPGSSEIPAAGIRAGVVFYAPAPGATPADPRFVLSWR